MAALTEMRDTASAVFRRAWAHLTIWLALLASVPGRRWWTPLRRPAVLAILGLGTVVVAVLMAVVDAPAANWAKRLPVWVIEPARAISEYGKSIWFLLPSFLVLTLVASTDRLTHSRRARYLMAWLTLRCGFVFVAVGLPSLFATTVKRLIGRARPSHDATGMGSFQPFAWSNDYASFPSGHASTAFAAAFAIGFLWPAARLWVAIYAVCVAASRVVLMSHYVSDVVAGALIAFVGVLMVREVFAAAQLGFVTTSAGEIRTKSRPRAGLLVWSPERTGLVPAGGRREIRCLTPTPGRVAAPPAPAMTAGSAPGALPAASA